MLTQSDVTQRSEVNARFTPRRFAILLGLRLCAHFEMETYTWDVMPAELKKRNVVDQLVGEYEWTLAALAARGIGRIE